MCMAVQLSFRKTKSTWLQRAAARMQSPTVDGHQNRPEPSECLRSNI